MGVKRALACESSSENPALLRRSGKRIRGNRIRYICVAELYTKRKLTRMNGDHRKSPRMPRCEHLSLGTKFGVVNCAT